MGGERRGRRAISACLAAALAAGLAVIGTPATAAQPRATTTAARAAAPAPAVESAFAEAPTAVVPGSQVDVTINVSGPAGGVAGTAYTYTAVIGNNSLPDADGAAFALVAPGGSTAVTATCSASGGATCPAALTVANTQVKGTAGLLPHNGRLTVTIAGRFAAPSASSVTCQGTVTAPAGTTDGDLTSNSSTVSTTVTNATSVVVAQTQTTTSMEPGSPNTYTLTWRNDGPADAAGTVTLAMMTFRTEVYASANITGFTCTASGGLVCPTTSATSVGGSFGVIFSQTQATFPAGATMTVTYTVDLVPAAVQGCGYSTVAVGNDVRATVPNGFANTGTADNFVYAYAPGTPACPTTDLMVTKSQSRSTIAPGSPVTYTVTYRNIGPGAADGASLTDAMYFATPVQSLAAHIVSCTPSGGAACPALADKTLTYSGQSLVQATAPVFPAGSTIQIVYTVDMSQSATPACSSSGSSSVENRAVVAVPAGVVEVGNQPNQASVYAAAPASPVCPRATLTATKTVDSTTMFPGDPVTYTVTYTNNGPDAADGATITDYLQLYNARFITNARVTIVSCTGTGGVACPSFVADKTVANDSYLWSGTLGAFPNGATLTIVAAVDPMAGGSTCPVATAAIPNTATITLPSGMVGSNGASRPVNVTAACADIAVNKSIDDASVRPGDPVTYAVRVSNASAGAARSVQFTDPLPRGFVFGSAACLPSSAASTCAAPAYDPATRTVSAVIPVVGPNQGYVTISIAGRAGPVGGTYSNTARAGSPTTGADRFVDPVASSNASTAVLTIYGTASTVAVTKRLTGLPAGGVPTALTFSGSISCDYEGTKRWTATVPAGASSAAASPVPFFDGQQCTVTEDTAPALPEGFSWVGAPSIEPADLAVTGPSADYAVTVANRLTPNAALTLAKTASRTQATVGQAVTFTYQVTNGGPIPVSAPVIHETSFSGSGPAPAVSCPPGEIAAGDSVDCTATYTITAADVATGLLTNAAYATATPQAGPEPQSAPATAGVRLVAPPALTLAKSAAPTTVSAVGDEVEFRYAVTNSGGVPLSGTAITETDFGGSGAVPEPSCPAAAATLSPGETATCTATYRVTQADLDRGTIANTALATATAPTGFADPQSAPSTATVTAAQRPAISLVKSVFPNSPVAFVPGVALEYSFLVTNTGTVTLDDVRVDETAFSGTGDRTEVACDRVRLAPGDQAVCSSTYSITLADAAAGELTNTATATGTPPAGPPVTSDADTATMPDGAAPALDLVKSATPTVVHRAGDTIRYAFAVTNTGNVPLTDPVVTEAAFTGAGPAPVATCPAGPVLPGATIACTADYSVTVADLDRSSIDNTATASATAPDSSTATSAPSSAGVAVVPGVPGLALEKTASVASIDAPGQRVAFRFTVTNTGRAPLADVRVTETDFTGTGTAPRISCPTGRALAPGGALTCTAGYVVTQADLDAGGLVNSARASAVPAAEAASAGASNAAGPPGPAVGTLAAAAEPVTASASVEVPADARPALTLTKTAAPSAPDAFVAGQPIAYTFVVTNTGNVTLSDATVVEGSFTGTGPLSPVCADSAPLAPGQRIACTATYRLTAADVDAGSVSNTAQAVANPPVGDPVHSPDATVTVPQATTLRLHLTKTAAPSVVHRPGDGVVFTFVVTNTGNRTVPGVAVHEVRFTGTGAPPAPSCPAADLAPGRSATCTAHYTVTRADLARTTIENTATASAGQAVSNRSTARVAVDPTDASAATATASGRLGATGSQSGPAATLAGLLVASGALLALVARRRRGPAG